VAKYEILLHCECLSGASLNWVDFLQRVDEWLPADLDRVYAITDNWKMLRSLALKGRRFESWAEVEQAIEAATAYWNRHGHPFIWGRHRRHQPRRQSGIARLPKAA
jgi:hypothetical protein